MRIASGGFAPGHVGGRFDAERLAKVGRNEPVRRYAHERHFRYQTVGPGECEILVVIVEAGPADIIDEALRRNAVGHDALVFLKLHMPPGEPRRQLRKRQQADCGSVDQRSGVDQHVVEQQGVIGGHGQRSVRQVRAEGAGLDAHGAASEFDAARVGDGLPRHPDRRRRPAVMGHDPVAGLQGFDGSVAVGRQNRRSGGEAVEDLRPVSRVDRREAPCRQGREVCVRQVVGDVILCFSAAELPAAAAGLPAENGVGLAFESDRVPREDVLARQERVRADIQEAVISGIDHAR